MPVVSLVVFLTARIELFGAETREGTSGASGISLSDYYGFMPVEIHKVHERSANLLAADLNHDGLVDLVTTNNAESRLDVMLQRKSPPAELSDVLGADANRLTSHWRFELKKLSVDREVTSLAVGDFNHDGRVDLATYEQPDQLVIRYQSEDGRWSQKKQFRIPEVPVAAWSIAAGDLNGDSLEDLAVLSKQDLAIFYQQANGEFAVPPKRILNTSDKMGLLQIADVDGDGRVDLSYLAGDGSARSFAVRLQMIDGSLGPESVFDLERPRAVTLKDVDPRPGHEVLCIEQRTGRLKLLAVESQTLAKGELPERLVHFGIGKASASRERDLQTGDIDGDGSTDVLVTDPESSRLILYRQKRGMLDLGTQFPGLVGADQARVADVDGDGRVEVIVQSAGEKTIGICRFEKDRLTFPQTLAVEGEPVAFEVTRFGSEASSKIIYVSRERKGREIAYSFRGLQFSDAGTWGPYLFPLAGKEPVSSIPIDPKGNPERLIQVDLHSKEHPGFLLFQGANRTPMVFSFLPEGFGEIHSAGGIGLGAVGHGAVFMCQLLEKRGVITAQENFARHLHLDDQRRWQVTEQMNVVESNAKISGVAALNLDDHPGDEVVMIDSGVKKLRIVRQEKGTYQPWKEIDLGEFAYRGLSVADLNSDGRKDLILIGAEKFAVLFAGGTTTSLKEIASFESRLEKIFPNDVVAGDLNGDGITDLAITDTRSRYIEIVNYRTGKGLQHALYFRSYEQKGFSNDDTPGKEPREAIVADVTGDGRQDLVVLTQDRLLVYPQDPGSVSSDK